MISGEVIFPLQMTFKVAPTMPAFCLLLLYSYYSNNFAGEIDASLDLTCLMIKYSNCTVNASCAYSFQRKSQPGKFKNNSDCSIREYQSFHCSF